jgi:flagellar biosynthetic protein FlhB
MRSGIVPLGKDLALMPDSAQERTERASPKRRSDARKRGQVARSAELPGAAALVAGALIARVLGTTIWQSFSLLLQNDLAQIARPNLTVSDVDTLFAQTVWSAALALAPVVAVLAGAGLVFGLAQTGLTVSARTLAPKFERISPLNGVKRLASPATGFEMLKMLVRLGVLVAVALTEVSQMASQVLTLSSVGVSGAPAVLGDVLFQIVLRVALAGALLAVADYAFQRWRFERELRMTKQEVKEEQRQLEGDPQIKSRIRRLQRELARRRMMQDAARSTVVVTNPTHYAVALRYVAGKSRAPLVVAKGQDYIAQQIIAIARRHNVPIVENPPLARALHAAVPIGREIPASLYRAVAEVLAFVYRLRRRW